MSRFKQNPLSPAEMIRKYPEGHYWVKLVSDEIDSIICVCYFDHSKKLWTHFLPHDGFQAQDMEVLAPCAVPPEVEKLMTVNGVMES